MADKDLTNILLRAEALMKTNWLHAIQILQQAVVNHPGDPRPLVTLGDFYQRRQLPEKGIKCYQTALKVMPDDDHLKLVIGNSYFTIGEYQKAIVYYDQIPHPSPDVLYNKALALAYQSKHEESIEIMRQLLDHIDNNPFIYFLLIEQMLRVEDYQSASEYIARAEKKIGLHKHLLLLKAICQVHYRNWLHAYHAFYTYEQNGDKMQNEHIVMYAESAEKSGMPERAVEILQKGVEEHPYSLVLYEDLIRLLIHSKQISEAKKYLKQAKKYYPVLSPLLKLMQSRLGSVSED